MSPSHHQPMLNQQGQGRSISQLPLPSEHGRAEEMNPSHHQPMSHQQGQGTSISQLPLPAEHGNIEEMNLTVNTAIKEPSL